MAQRRTMYADGWGGNHRNPPPRDNYATRPFSGNQVPNRGPANDLADMAATMRAMTKLAANRDREPGHRPNTEPPRERPQPAREDPYARRQDTDRREDPYARRQESRRQEDPKRSGSPRKDDPYARRNDLRHPADPGYKGQAEQPRGRPEPYREDPYARRNEQRKWADSPKDSTQWPGSHMIARAGFPAYREGYDQPLQAQRSPYVNREDARRSLVSHRRYSGSSGTSYRSGSSFSSRSGRWLSENKFRLIIAIIVGVTLLAMALGGVALWLFLKDDDAYPMVYEVNVYLPKETWKDGMKSAENKDYKDMNKKYCDAMKKVFGGVLLKCVVDNLKKGSVKVYSSLTFDWNDLTDLVKKTDKKPELENIYAYIKSEIEKSDGLFKDATVTVQVIPDKAEYEFKLHLSGMNFTDDLNDATSTLYKNTATDYCNAMKEAFSDTMTGCDVTGYENGSVIVNSKLSFDTAKLKEKAKEDGGSADLANLGSVLKNELKKAANKTEFFKANGLDTDDIGIKSETIVIQKTTPATTTTTTTKTTTQEPTTTSTTVIEVSTASTSDQITSSTAAVEVATVSTATGQTSSSTKTTDISAATEAPDQTDSTATPPEQTTATTTTGEPTSTTSDQTTATTTTGETTSTTSDQTTATTTTGEPASTSSNQIAATTTTGEPTSTTSNQTAATTTTGEPTSTTSDQTAATTTTGEPASTTSNQTAATTTTGEPTSTTSDQTTATITTGEPTSTTSDHTAATTTTGEPTSTTSDQTAATTTTGEPAGTTRSDPTVSATVTVGNT